MRKSALAAAYVAIASLIAPARGKMATNPQALKPSQLLRLVNGTPAGQVLTERKLRAHRQRAATRIGGEKSIDLLKYCAWLATEWKLTPGDSPAAKHLDPDELYRQKKERERKRNAAISRSGRDIGPLPAAEQPTRKAAAVASFRLFCETYFPGRFYLAWSRDHEKVLDRLQRAIDDGGLFALAMPRGSGKTALCEAAVLWATMTGRRQFVVLVGASRAAAAESADAIRAELETNDLLAADFPEVCHPIRKLEGFANRCIGQLCDDQRTHIGWSADEIVLPTIAGSRASGAIIRLAGITGRIRGMKYVRPDGANVRPSFVLIDDPQTDKSAASVGQCWSRERIIHGAILGLAGPGQPIAAVCPCTVVRPGDVADRLLDRDKHPEWQGERFKLLYQFPTNMKRWEEYRDLRMDSLKNDGDGREATAYYKKHRKEMDAGAVVAWSQRKEKTDLSALQYAMNLYFDDQPAFFAEYQNEPLSDEQSADQLDPDELARRANFLDRGIVPLACSRLTAFVDVQKAALYWIVCGWTEDFGGAIVDYGTWPDQARRYFSLTDIQRTLAKRYPKHGLEGYLYAGLTDLAKELLDRKWQREDGAELSIERMLVDANWGESTDVVYQWCRESPHRALVAPSHGKYLGAKSTPFHEWKRKPGERLGNHWIIPNVAGKRAIRHVLIDTNWWKSFLVARLTTAVGDRGALALPGKPGAEQRLLTEHLTSEFAVRTSGRGRELDEWDLRPGRDNHWWDGLVGCAVAASLLGVTLLAGDRSKPTAVAKPKRQRVSYL